MTLKAKTALEEIAEEAPDADWFKGMVRDRTATEELYRCPTHGFFLHGHVEGEGKRWPPHNHGSGWIVYAVAQGESEMGTFGTVIDPSGALQVIQKERFTLRAGESRVFLPGDIHQTRSLEPDTVLLRLGSCDFGVEKASGRLIRFKSVSGW